MAEEKELTRKEALKNIEKLKNLYKEKNQLNVLVRKGVDFSVDDKEVVKEKRFFGLFRKKKIVNVKRNFTIKEPTLDTLDRLSAEWLELDISETELQSEDGAVSYAKRLANTETRRCARIVAIAVLDTEYYYVECKGSRIVYNPNDKKLEELTDLFYRRIKPSQLLEFATIINIISNLGDFMSSIRLMTAQRTTTPNRIED